MARCLMALSILAFGAIGKTTAQEKSPARVKIHVVISQCDVNTGRSQVLNNAILIAEEGQSAFVNLDGGRLGINLHVTSKLIGDGQIQLSGEPEYVTPGPIIQVDEGVTSTAFNLQEFGFRLKAANKQTVKTHAMKVVGYAVSEWRIPWLSEIPVIGDWFRFVTETKVESKIFVELTPFVQRLTPGSRPTAKP